MKTLLFAFTLVLVLASTIVSAAEVSKEPPKPKAPVIKEGGDRQTEQPDEGGGSDDRIEHADEQSLPLTNKDKAALKALGITTVKQLAKADAAKLAPKLGGKVRARNLIARAKGYYMNLRDKDMKGAQRKEGAARGLGSQTSDSPETGVKCPEWMCPPQGDNR